VITSDGEVFENKHFFKSREKKIAKLQRQLSKKQKGSNNRNKQRVKIAKEFERLTNQKEAYIHSVVNELFAYYDTVFMEDLNVQGMLKNHKLAKAIQEIGLYRFRQILEDKARNNYKEVVFVGRFYPSSKTCHKCGYVNKELALNDREWTCPRCGEHHDRDLNAAINILMEGEKIIGSRTTEFAAKQVCSRSATLADYPTMDERGLTT
jgi:putative transposase